MMTGLSLNVIETCWSIIIRVDMRYHITAGKWSKSDMTVNSPT